MAEQVFKAGNEAPGVEFHLPVDPNSLFGAAAGAPTQQRGMLAIQCLLLAGIKAAGDPAHKHQRFDLNG